MLNANVNENKNNSLSINNSDEISKKDVDISTESSCKLDDVKTSTQSTYETFSWLFAYTKMFTKRLFKDLLWSIIGYIYTGQIVPNHIVNLMSVQKSLQFERESQTVTHTRENDISFRWSSLRGSFSALKKYVLSSEDDIGRQGSSTRNKEPMFVIVDSSCISNPSSQELLIENKRETILKKNYNKCVMPIGIPSTSRDTSNIQPFIHESESVDELQMFDINLQSENEISIDNEEIESIVISYLQNKDNVTNNKVDTLVSSKKKSSILEDVPKMETILEGEQFSSFPLTDSQVIEENKKEDSS